MKKIFCLSGDYSKEKKNYIVGTGRFALLQFTSMLQEDVYIEAFCSFDESVIGMNIMNKTVLDIRTLATDKEANFIIAEENFENCEKKLEELGITNTWVDIRMFSLINDCVWTFM